MSMGIISKDKKRIEWRGIEGCSLANATFGGAADDDDEASKQARQQTPAQRRKAERAEATKTASANADVERVKASIVAKSNLLSELSMQVRRCSVNVK
jgi:hypothetical protein